jgi:hypothetical protein
MLVNKSVLATQVLVQNGRANYFVRKLRAATIGTLILQPAIDFIFFFLSSFTLVKQCAVKSSEGISLAPWRVLRMCRPTPKWRMKLRY